MDAWEHAQPKGKWTQVSADYRVLDALVLDALVKEKKITWTKSARESAKREAELLDMLEKGATNEKKEGRDKDNLGDRLEAFLTRKEEEDEATGLMEETRKNVVAAQQKNFEAEQSLCNALREYVDNFGRDLDQVRTRMTKCWQSVQSRGTKNMDLAKDLEDTHFTARRVGGNEEDKTRRQRAQDEGDEQKAPHP